MFCFQCEQTMRPEAGRTDVAAGCATTKGVCGKDEVTADLQDLLVHQLKGIAQIRTRLSALGGADAEADSFVLFALFTTLTNVNFNRTRFVALIAEAAQIRDRLRAADQAACQQAGQEPDAPEGPAAFVPADTLPGLLAQVHYATGTLGVRTGIETAGADVIGLRALLLYGLKGVAAYAHHAEVLGERRAAIADGIARALDVLAGDPADLNALLEEALALGRCNFVAMEALDAANTGTFGTPAPAAVRTTPVAGKAILVSGHDLRDLAAILEATKEPASTSTPMASCCRRTAIRSCDAHPHLAGNYGGAWQNQQTEFAAFPGPIVMTSNCLIEPQAAYRTASSPPARSAGRDLRHIDNGDFRPVVQAALRRCPDSPRPGRNRPSLVGFGQDAVLGVAGTVIEAVKSGALKPLLPDRRLRRRRPRPQLLHRVRRGGADGLVVLDARLWQVPLQHASISAPSPACRGCSTSGSATTPIPRW